SWMNASRVSSALALLATTPTLAATITVRSQTSDRGDRLGLSKLFVERALPRSFQPWRHCASSGAFAWLGGIERFLGTDGRIGFHAASNPDSVRERGILRYLTKIGLPYDAIMYITQAASNEMTGVA